MHDTACATMIFFNQCSKFDKKSCQSCCLESKIINIKLKKSFKKVPGPPPNLSASGWRTGSNLEHCFNHWRVIMVVAGGLAPVPLSIFRSNSKFDENSKHSSVKYTRPITTIFCTRHDSVTVVTCAKYRCDRPSTFETRAFWIFIEFRIRSKYA